MPKPAKPIGFVIGTTGDDAFIATRAAEKFVLGGAGGGHDTVSGFNAAAGDRVMIDEFGSYSDIPYLGKLSDGLTIHTVTGGEIHISITDYDGNGTLDTAHGKRALSALEAGDPQGTSNNLLNSAEGATGVYAALVDTGHLYLFSAHQFYSSLSGVVGTDQEILTKTQTTGTFDGTDLTYTASRATASRRSCSTARTRARTRPGR
jgi:hypothetical protein